jgi:hypothetical protein
MSPGSWVLARGRRLLSFPVLWVLFVLLFGVATNAYLALRPAALGARVRAGLESFFAAPVSFASSDVSWRGGVEVRGLRVGRAGGDEEDGDEAILEAPSVRLIPDLWALLAGRFELSEVLVASPVLRPRRAAGGAWNLAGLLREREGVRDPAFRPPRVRIRDARVLYRDEASFARPIAEDLTGVRAELEPAGAAGHAARFRVDLALEGARGVTLRGELARGKSGLEGEVEIDARRVDLARRPEGLLPEPAARKLREAGIQGFADLVARFRVAPGEGVVPLEVAGKVTACDFAPPELPFAVRHLEAGFEIEPSGDERGALELTVTDARGRIDDGDLSGSGRALLSRPGLELESWSVRLGLDPVPLDGRLASLLDPELRESFDASRPKGSVRADVEVAGAADFPPEMDRVAVRLRLEGLGVSVPRTPYRVEDARGEVRLEAGKITVTEPVRGRLGEARVEVSGAFDAAAGGEVDLAIKVESFPLDRRLRAAMPEAAGRVWDWFQFTGAADATVTLARSARQGAGAAVEPLRVVLQARPRAVRLSYVRFPYEVTDITGSVSFDSATRRLVLVDLKGRHGDQVITSDGAVELGDPPLFKISLGCEALAVDGDLAAALPEHSRRLLEDFGLEGRLATQVSIHTTGEGTVEAVTELDILDGRLRHRRFPYLLELAGGHMRLAGDRIVEFSGVRTAGDARPLVVFDGDLITEGAERSLTFRFDIARLPFDGKFVEALPPDLKRFVESLDMEGVYNGVVEGTYRFHLDDPARDRIIYSGRNIHSTDAAVDFGLKVREMVARGEFVGRKEPGEPHSFVGHVAVESALFNRLRLTNGQVDFTYGRVHPAVEETQKLLARRDAAGGEAAGGARPYLPPERFVERLTGPEAARNVFQMLVQSQDLYGGRVDGFLFVDGGARGDTGGDLVGEKLEVAEAAEDVFGAAGTGSKGHASGRIGFSGKTGEPLTITGDGHGRIEEARLVELPLFLGILSVLFGETSGRHYFNDVAMRFEIGKGRFRARAGDLRISSQGLKLYGGGTLDFAGNLDLAFEPRLFGFEVPVVEQLLSLLKKGLAQIWVTGDLRAPKVEFVTGAGALRLDVTPKDEDGTSLPEDLREELKEGRTPGESEG